MKPCIKVARLGALTRRNEVERFELSGKEIRIRLPTYKKSSGFSFGSLPRRLTREKTAPPAGLSVTRSSSRDPINVSSLSNASASGSAVGPPKAASAGAGTGLGSVGVGIGRSSSNSPLYLDVPRTHQSTPSEATPSSATASPGGMGYTSSLSPSPLAANANGAALKGDGAGNGHNLMSDTPPPPAASRDSHSPGSLHVQPSTPAAGVCVLMYCTRSVHIQILRKVHTIRKRNLFLLLPHRHSHYSHHYCAITLNDHSRVLLAAKGYVYVQVRHHCGGSFTLAALRRPAGLLHVCRSSLLTRRFTNNVYTRTNILSTDAKWWVLIYGLATACFN